MRFLRTCAQTNNNNRSNTYLSIEGETCKSTTTALNQCNVMDGKLTLYLSDTSNATFYFQQVVNSLRTGMSDDGELLTANSAIVKLTLLETSNKQIFF